LVEHLICNQAVAGSNPAAGTIIPAGKAFSMIRILLALSLIAITLPAQAVDLPPGFVRLADVAPGIRQEIRYATANNFVGRPIDGYGRGDCWLRREAAEALAKVAVRAEGWRLLVYDCYRPTRAVADFVAWSKDATDQKMKAEYYPEIDKSLLFKAGFIATRSEHSRGNDGGHRGRDG
jgi:zinc D-Ala-D-Ala dipeptidase